MTPDNGTHACVLIADFTMDDNGMWVPKYHFMDLSTTVKGRHSYKIRSLTRDGFLVQYITGQDEGELRQHFSYLLVNKTAETFKTFKSQCEMQDSCW